MKGAPFVFTKAHEAFFQIKNGCALIPRPNIDA